MDQVREQVGRHGNFSDESALDLLVDDHSRSKSLATKAGESTPSKSSSCNPCDDTTPLKAGSRFEDQEVATPTTSSQNKVATEAAGKWNSPAGVAELMPYSNPQSCTKTPAREPVRQQEMQKEKEQPRLPSTVDPDVDLLTSLARVAQEAALKDIVRQFAAMKAGWLAD